MAQRSVTLGGIVDVPTGLFIDGQWEVAHDGATVANINPVDGQTLAEVSAAGSPDVDRAVEAARRQFDSGQWSSMSGADRAGLLQRLADLMDRDAEKLSTIQSFENGAPRLAGAMFDVPGSAATLRYFAGWADKLTGTVIPTPGFMGREMLSYTVRQPRGVMAAIVPWNTPLAASINKLAPALAAGCTVVLKPSEEAQLAVHYLGLLIQEAGIPDGTVNIVTGVGQVAGAALVAHPGVDHISFTGSPEIGKQIARTAADSLTHVTLELGGKSPQLVFADADIRRALQDTATGLFVNQGQICAAASRVLVHRDVYREFVDGLGAAAASMRVGDPNVSGNQLGPVISQRQLDRVLGYIHAGKEEGARLVAGGSRVGSKGFFVEPTIFADATNDMTIAREEIFGPVGTVIPFDDDEHALALANDSAYGLTATVWTSDISRAHSLAHRLRSGTVWINGWGAVNPALPWTGFNGSGTGTELGLRGLEEVTEEKVVSVML
ncbi:phenylacetaldehyde dehydrogenase [Microbacterium faecale]|uniref:Phenylacetaldehyde dehydrogenase n=1 Tax=Microbacterium faecale TaxID=1804630 RepID=A0A916YII2_9MICO|nr:aldehyde dehydrogenase family protein [Microbacterium faecale]GGD46278.1 phenylacetaldehyde dehydrogenase [Microbacterium faecale]